jgi:AcrR family transcriptional regulator
MARPRGDSRERIVAAAREEFLRVGVEGASLRAIARAGRTNIGTIYYYFPTKDELFLEVIEQPYEQITARLAVALAGEEPFTERLERLYLGFSALSEQERELLVLVVREALSSSQRLDRMFERFTRGHVPLFLALLEAGYREGKVPRELPPLLAFALLMGVGIVPQVGLRVIGSRVGSARAAGLALDAPALASPGGRELAALLAGAFVRAVAPPGRQP